MKLWERVKLLLGVATYRTRLAFFILLGVTLVSLAILLESNPFWNNILIQIAVVFITVGLVDFLSDFLGGDPLELRIDSVHRSMVVLSDIVDGNLGIERAWPNRRAWENDTVNGLAAWKEGVCQAKQADIVSNTLWTRWFHDEAFRTEFFKSLRRGTTARIVIYDPEATILITRARDEKDPGSASLKQKPIQTQMQNEINSTLEVIARERLKLDDAAKRNLQLRLTTEYYHLAQIVRADDRILVAIYLSGKTGSPSPTFQFKGPQAEYFRTYAEQIEIIWNRGREINEDALNRFLVESK